MNTAGWQGEANAEYSVGFLPKTKLEFAVSDELVDKTGATTSESLGKPPFGSRPLIAGGRQAA